MLVALPILKEVIRSLFGEGLTVAEIQHIVNWAIQDVRMEEKTMEQIVDILCRETESF